MNAFQEDFLEHDELEDYDDSGILENDFELDLELDELDVSSQELEAEEEIGRRSRVPVRPPRTRPLPPRSQRPRPQPARRPPAYRPKPPRGIRRHPRSVFVDEPVTCVCPEPTCPEHGTEYVRWVQSALNDVLGLRLPLNGVMGPETRSAVRSFQEREGLPVTGIVGPDIESALIAARAGKSPGAEDTKPPGPDMAEPAATPPEPASAKPAAEFEFEWETPEKFGDAEGLDETHPEWFESELEETIEPEIVTPAGAVDANRLLARRIGWGCVRAGRVEPIDGVLRLLGLGAGASEEDLANGVARFQDQQLRRHGTGRLDGPVWDALLRRDVLPARPRFKAEKWPVYFGGKQLGVVEKTRPYANTSSATHGSVEIELGFRVTDTSAVRRAGFVDASGDDNFRWMQSMLSAGARGGSLELRRFLNRLINEGQFPGHCFVGEGFTGNARCR